MQIGSDLLRVRLIQLGDAEPVWYDGRVTWTTQHALAKLNALSDGSGNTIYPGDTIIIGDDRATCCPGANDRRIVDVEFGNSMNDGALRR